MTQADFAGSDDGAMLRSRCVASKGLYQQQFDWAAIKGNIQQAFGLDSVDYRFTLENPDNKVYSGRSRRDLQIACYDAATDTLMVKGNCHYRLGSVYDPVIVNPRPLRDVLLQGIVIALLLALAVYLVLQLAVPYVRYRLFLRKHVVAYSGPLMGAEGLMLGETCYLCKAPFAVGDRVVKKCRHSVHLDCWEENGGQCPEYGRHCHDGRHYYNRQQLLDPENATFYLRWVIVAILAGLAAWLTYTVQMHPLLSAVSERIILFMGDIRPGTPEAEARIAEYSSLVNHFPSFGLCIGFFLTLMLSCLSVAQREWSVRIADITLRTLDRMSHHRISKDHPEYFYADGIHLSAEGRRAYCDAVLSAVSEPYLNEWRANKAAAEAQYEAYRSRMVSFFGNDLLTNVYPLIEEDYPYGSFKTYEQFDAGQLMADIRSAAAGLTLADKVVLLLDDTAVTEQGALKQLAELCGDRKLFLVTPGRTAEVAPDGSLESVKTWAPESGRMFMADGEHLSSEANEALRSVLLSLELKKKKKKALKNETFPLFFGSN